MAIVRDVMIAIGFFTLVVVSFNLILGDLMTDYDAEPFDDPNWQEDYDYIQNFTATAQAQQESALKDIPIVGAVIEVWQKTTAAIRLVGGTVSLFFSSVVNFLGTTLKLPPAIVNFIPALMGAGFAFIIISALRKYKV
tara:strand:- start:1025 stop:1438 length:414 start_codon:yes stop_codon:yes gene_type:complete